MQGLLNETLLPHLTIKMEVEESTAFFMVQKDVNGMATVTLWEIETYVYLNLNCYEQNEQMKGRSLSVT